MMYDRYGHPNCTKVETKRALRLMRVSPCQGTWSKACLDYQKHNQETQSERNRGSSSGRDRSTGETDWRLEFQQGQILIYERTATIE